ncbi:MAG: DinB family protein [Saprospiraceae bacterium]
MISFIDSFKYELEQESVQTRRMLQIVPADKMDWKPHPKSMTISSLTNHLAEMPIMISLVLDQDKWDFTNMPYTPVVSTNAEELVARFDECVKSAQNSLDQADDSILQKKWLLCAGEAVYLDLEKWQAIRHAFGQNVHHRAQLQVNLRLLNIPVPGPYGPSADEM